MKTLHNKVIIYDDSCPLCQVYTKAFIKVQVLNTNGRISFQQADAALLSKLNLNRARHEIPLVDTQTGEILYGLDSLTLIVANILPFTKSFITKTWFKTLLRPLYKFISYNRGVIVNAKQPAQGFSCSPDFSAGWRLALIALGMFYTAACIFAFAHYTRVADVFTLYIWVFGYFLLLQAANLIGHKTVVQRLNYTAHLAMLGLFEGTTFILIALIAAKLEMPGLMFAGQGAGRLLAFDFHHKRVLNNGFSKLTDYAFATGAVIMICYLAYILK
ncbi:MAG: DCC1-like thiol-disulfide oxidoreductase family protein [Chitinophagales bacterium]